MIVGVDPGMHGGVAWLDDFGRLIEVRDLPTVKREGLLPAVLAAWLREDNRHPHTAWIEQVGSRPGEGASRAFNFGRGYGQLEGVMAALGIPVKFVSPAVWKRALRVTADKSSSRARAAQLWPGLAGTFARVKDDGRAEAALIGLYGANQSHDWSTAA